MLVRTIEPLPINFIPRRRQICIGQASYPLIVKSATSTGMIRQALKGWLRLENQSAPMLPMPGANEGTHSLPWAED
jgi:hypothetical protein